MILFDQETTALIKNQVIPLEQQPSVIEFGAARLDDKTLEILDTFSVLVRPPILPLSDEIIKITGIKTEHLKEALPFAAHYQKIVDFFLGERTVVCHNAPFDCGILAFELQRLDKLTYFPWPPRRICTAEIGQNLFGKYQHLKDLRKLATGNEEHVQTHRGLDDVMDLVEVVRWLRKEHGAI